MEKVLLKTFHIDRVICFNHYYRFKNIWLHLLWQAQFKLTRVGLGRWGGVAAVGIKKEYCGCCTTEFHEFGPSMCCCFHSGSCGLFLRQLCGCSWDQISVIIHFILWIPTQGCGEVWIVEFDHPGSASLGPVFSLQQMVCSLDVVNCSRAHTHDAAPGDAVLSPWEPDVRRYGPGRVLTANTERSDGSRGQVSSSYRSRRTKRERNMNYRSKVKPHHVMWWGFYLINISQRIFLLIHVPSIFNVFIWINQISLVIKKSWLHTFLFFLFFFFQETFLKFMAEF